MNSLSRRQTKVIKLNRTDYETGIPPYEVGAEKNIMYVCMCNNIFSAGRARESLYSLQALSSRPKYLYLSAMQFLREQLTVSLADPGKTNTFICEVFEERPSFEVILKYKPWSEECRERMQEAMQRKNCAVTWVALYIDKHGCLMIVHFAHVLIVGSAKTAAGVLLRSIPQLPEEQTRAAEKSLRPLDEADLKRIAEFETVDSLRPTGNKRKREEDDEDLPLSLRPTKRYKSVEEFLKENASDSEEEVPRPRLMLTNEPHQQPSAICNPLDPCSVWEYLVKKEATIIVAEAGKPPERLAYIRCHREARRHLLLQNCVTKEYDNPKMPQFVKIAFELAKDGKIPGADGGHGKKAEFFRRCAEALKKINPRAETDLSKLSKEDQYEIRVAMGEKEKVYEGCLSEGCLDKEPSWMNKEFGESSTISICTRCRTFRWCQADAGKGLNDAINKLEFETNHMLRSR